MPIDAEKLDEVKEEPVKEEPKEGKPEPKKILNEKRVMVPKKNIAEISIVDGEIDVIVNGESIADYIKGDPMRGRKNIELSLRKIRIDIENEVTKNR